MLSRGINAGKSSYRVSNLTRIAPGRFLSTLLAKNPNSITPGDLKSSSLHTEDSDQNTKNQVELIRLINSSKNLHKQQIINELIPNFSLFFRLTKSDDIPSTELLTRFIEVNPGRVYQSWDLFKKYEQLVEVTDELIAKVIEKLVYGEASDDGYKLEPENFERINYLLTTYECKSGHLVTLMDKLVEDENQIFLNAFVNSELVTLEFLSKFIGKTSDFGYLSIFARLFQQNPSLLSKEQLILALEKLQEPEIVELWNESQDSNLKHGSLDPVKLTTEVLNHISTNELDLDKSPESLLLRIKLISTYGIHQNDLEKASEKFHTYQSRDKFGLDLVQTELLKAYAYQAVNQDKQIFAKIAETLRPADIPIKVLQMLMVCQSAFDAESALKWYNEYIQKVSKNINEHTKRSPTGLLTESLLVSNLYDNDRNFATLVFDKAIENGIISDEMETSQIKKVFKVYGEAFNDHEDWENAKPIFKKYVLNYIKNL